MPVAISSHQNNCIASLTPSILNNSFCESIIGKAMTSVIHQSGVDNSIIHCVAEHKFPRLREIAMFGQSAGSGSLLFGNIPECQSPFAQKALSSAIFGWQSDWTTPIGKTFTHSDSITHFWLSIGQSKFLSDILAIPHVRSNGSIVGSSVLCDLLNRSHQVSPDIGGFPSDFLTDTHNNVTIKSPKHTNIHHNPKRRTCKSVPKIGKHRSYRPRSQRSNHNHCRTIQFFGNNFISNITQMSYATAYVSPYYLQDESKLLHQIQSDVAEIKHDVKAQTESNNKTWTKIWRKCGEVRNTISIVKWIIEFIMKWYPVFSSFLR